MHFLPVLALGVASFCQCLATPSLAFHVLEDRTPAACSSPKPVQIAYNVLSVLRASSFCTRFLSISTKTVQTVQVVGTTVSFTITATSTIFDEFVTETTTLKSTTTTLSSTIQAPALIITVPASTTVFTPSTATTTSTILATSVSTTYIYDVEDRKVKRAPTALPEPRLDLPKPALLKGVADNIISSACSCLATTPVSVLTTTTSTTLSLSFDELELITSTSVVSTSVQTDLTVFTETTFTTSTPISLITSTTTFFSPTVVSTAVRTTTVTQVRFEFISVILVPIQLNGCTVGQYNALFPNVGGPSQEAATRACAARCVTAGRVFCDDFFINEVLPTRRWDCYLLNQAQQVNTNFFCNNPNIDRAAEVIIIY